MESGASITLGFAGHATPRTIAGLASNGQEPIITGGRYGAEAMAFVLHRFSEKNRVQLFAMHGFTTASPDIALGATLRFTF